MKVRTVDGNEACSSGAYLFTEVAGIYPITPASTMAELVDEWSRTGKQNIFNDTVKVVEMQSEAGAIAMVHGTLQTGVLASTFTASQGLLLMLPNMYKIAGQLFPCVIHVAARSLATHALSIMGDHQDVYAARATGFAYLASSSVQDAAILSVVSHLSTIEGSIPFLHFFDGFRTSHELQKVKILETNDIKHLINFAKINDFRKRALTPNTSMTRGTNQGDDVYFQNTESRNKYYEQLPDVVNYYMEEINKVSLSDYKPFNYYGSATARKVIVAMGSVCETIKEYLKLEDNKDLGLVEVHLYRPFSSKYFFNVLPRTVTDIAVIDRTKEAGSIGEPLYLDVASILKDKDIKIIHGRYGLSSKDTNLSAIHAIYENLLQDKPIEIFTVGIIDDVTNLSLEIKPYQAISSATELLIYGYGSDGMVSASKSIIKIIGDNTRGYVQAYFQYDSKKSGGVTRSHLRISNDYIYSTYYVTNPYLVVCSKESYLDKYDMLSGIKEKGIFLVNTNLSETDFLAKLQERDKQILASRDISVYLIDASQIARDINLPGKISMIMESAIFKILDIIDYEGAKKLMKEIVEKEFSLKGQDIVANNYKGIEEASQNLIKVNIPSLWKDLKIASPTMSVLDTVNALKGDSLPVSAFDITGTVTGDNTKFEKRKISESVPKWISENCIQCNKCSFVCPHAVIRPFLIDNATYESLPKDLKTTFIPGMAKDIKDAKYTISVSIEDCTGCGLCSKTCPGKLGNKALEMDDFNNHQEEIKKSNYLFNQVTNLAVFNNETVKGSQFNKPRFTFNGSCAGCGETPYIKLATQLFGDSMVIANATGCSSIYGASYPSMPYSIPWANSLFEDNAEFGFGMSISSNVLRKRIATIMETTLANETASNQALFKEWLANYDDYAITKKVYDNLDYHNEELANLKEYIVKRTFFIIGGDGWAYDIGYGGLDHVLASGEDVNILVLDTEVYSNTGGQASKATRAGAIASFAASGKKTAKKDLARMAMSYHDVYVASISLGANPEKTVKAFNEAVRHKGPSLIIAYAPCIAHGIKGGMSNSIDEEIRAVECGYYPIFRYLPLDEKLVLDMKEPDFTKFNDFLMNETRYKVLEKVNEEYASELLESNKKEAMARYQYYLDIANK